MHPLLKPMHCDPVEVLAIINQPLNFSECFCRHIALKLTFKNAIYEKQDEGERLGNYIFVFFLVVVAVVLNAISSFLNSLDDFLRFLGQPQSKILKAR